MPASANFRNRFHRKETAFEFQSSMHGRFDIAHNPVRAWRQERGAYARLCRFNAGMNRGGKWFFASAASYAEAG